MGFITHYCSGRSGICKPSNALTALALCWAAIVWGLWPQEPLRALREVSLIGFLAVWTVLWWRWSVLHPKPLSQLKWGILALLVVALLIPPFHSTDVYGYINRGWQQVAYHTNPYAITIDQLASWEWDDRFTHHWTNNPCPYGFVFAWITWLTCLLAWPKTALVGVFKLTQLAVTAVIAWMLARLTTLQAHLRGDAPPDEISTRATLPLTALLWHPLWVIHGIANAHNDGWVALANVGAVFASQTLPVWAFPALMLGGLVKLAPLVTLPVTLATVWRLQGWRSGVLSGLLGLGLLTGFAWPYVQDAAAIQLSGLADNAGLSHNSLHALITDAYQVIQPVLLPFMPQYAFMYGWLKGILWGLYGFLALWLTALPFRASCWNWRKWALCVFWLQVGLLLLASSKFHGWYLNMVLPLLWLMPRRVWWVRALLLVSLANCFGIGFMGRAHIINTLLMTIAPIVWAYTRRYQYVQATDASKPVIDPAVADRAEV